MCIGSITSGTPELTLVSTVVEQYDYVYNGSSLVQMVVTTTTTADEETTTSTDTLFFAYDASGSPLSVTYNNTDYYYTANIQGDIVGVVDSTGTQVVSYSYDAWGNALSVTGTLSETLGSVNPLRYRGYVYDTDTGLFYLQSRYYNPEIGRFINADALVSTVQGFIGNNMYAYCGNNPVVFFDPTGFRFVGFGVQLEIQVGDISYGVEIVFYTDSLVCDGKDLCVALYTYSGYDISLDQLDQVNYIIETLVTTLAFTTDNTDVQAWYSAVTFILNGAGASGGAFYIDGNDYFDSPEDYSGHFATQSVSVPYKGTTITGFHAESPTCDAYGVKIGVSFSGLRERKKKLFTIAYSHSDYSKPKILLEV